MKRTILIPVIVLLLCTTAFAFDMLTSARGGGMGISYFVLADDPSGTVYNPAGIGYVGGMQSYLMFNMANNYQYVVQDETPYNGRFAVVYPLQDIGVVAVNTQQSGSLAKVTGIPTVNQGNISYGREFAPGWSAGGSVKYMYETMFGKRSAFDIDLGLAYRAPNGIVAAAAFENITRAKFSPEYLGIQEYLPRRERVGLGYILNNSEWQAAFIAASQIEESGITEKNTTTLMNLGSEWWFLKGQSMNIGLRTGYTFGEGVVGDIVDDYSSFNAGISFNFRVGINDLRLDYGMQTYPYTTTDGSTPMDHFVALNYGWGGVPDYGSSLRDETFEDPVIYKPAPKEKPGVVDVFNENEDSKVIDRDTDFEAKQYFKYDIMMDVADISAVGFKRIVFYIRPQQILQTNSWKLYVFRAKVKDWNQEEIDRWALKVIEGNGVPPLNVVWNGISQNGTLLPPGKYYYILTAEDAYGNSYATKWHDFKLE